MSDSSFKVFVRLLVTNQVRNGFQVEIILTFPILMLAHNLLDLVSVMRETHRKLIPLLEGTHIEHWPIQFFDVESRCKINCKLQGLN